MYYLRNRKQKKIKKMMQIVVIICLSLLLTPCQKYSELSLKDYYSDVELEYSDADNHIKYYGFSIVNTHFDDPYDDEVKTNYVDEVKSFTNIADVVAVEPDISISEDIKSIIDEGLLVYIHVFELFFEVEGTSETSGYDYKIRDDYKDRWILFCEQSQLDIFIDDICFIYLGEEPLWNGISYEELVKAVDCIKEYDNRLEVMIIEAFPVVKQLEIPVAVDYIGFDKYYVANPIEDNQYMDLFDNLKEKLEDHQRIILVMDAHFIEGMHDEYGGVEFEDMDDVANSYYQMAKEYEEIVGIIGYCWPSGFDNETAVGARNMPQNIVDMYKKIGRQIIGDLKKFSDQ